jgi:ABC-type transport system substrate-binding protein
LPGAWEHGRSITLTRHEGYFKPGLPYIDTIQWSYHMSPLTQRYLLEAGELEGNHELALADALRFHADPRWKPFGVYEAEIQTGAINLNVEIAPFDNVEVRRAVACAIDRERIHLLRITNLRPLGRMIPHYLAGDDPTFPEQKYDVAAALDHMKRAGLEYDPKTGRGGWPNTITYVVYRQGLDEQTAQIFQQELAAIGLRIELKLVNTTTFSALTRRRHEAAMSPGAWSQDFPDPGDFIEPIFATSAINDEDSNNSSFYSNPTLDDLLSRARREMDPTARAKMYRDADAIVTGDAPWVSVFAYRFFSVHQPYVRGYAPHPVWNEDMRTVWLDRAGHEIEKHAGVLGSVLEGHP